MKSKEVIRMIQELDPTGEKEVCVDNVDILDIELEPAFWDGCLQRLVRDPKKAPFYDVIGGEYISEGDKISIRPYSIRDAIMQNPELPVSFKKYNIGGVDLKEVVKKYREEAYELDRKIPERVKRRNKKENKNEKD